MKKWKLSTKAIAKLRVVERQIVKSPKFYDQNTFGIPTPCGTVCCITGWLHYNEVGARKHNAFVKSADWHYDLRPEGSEILGVSEEVTNNIMYRDDEEDWETGFDPLQFVEVEGWR